MMTAIETYYDLQNLKRAKYQAFSAVRLLTRQLNYRERDIQGLCLKRDSCPQCRQARCDDQGYQHYLARKRRLELILARSATTSDIEGRIDCDQQGWIDFYQKWIDQLRTDTAQYKNDFPN